MPVVSKMNPDIKAERDKVGFKVEEFTNWFHGGAEKVKEKRFFGNANEILTDSKLWPRFYSENYFMNDPELQDKVSTSYLSHKEVYEESIRKSTVTLKKLKQLQVQGQGGPDLYS